MEARGFLRKRCADIGKMYLRFVFSLPSFQNWLKKSLLTRWTKWFDSKDAANAGICDVLQTSMDESEGYLFVL